MPYDIEVTLVRRKVTNVSILESAASCKKSLSELPNSKIGYDKSIFVQRKATKAEHSIAM